MPVGMKIHVNLFCITPSTEKLLCSSQKFIAPLTVFEKAL